MGRRLALLALLLGLAALSPARARADGSAVERLSPQELEHLQRNVPAWDDLPVERRERIAKNVLKLRDLTPEERARFRDRIDRFQKEDASRRGRLPERLAKLDSRSSGGQPREHFRLHAVLAGALGRALFQDLPEDVRTALAAPTAEGGSVRPPMVGMAFAKAVMNRAADAVLKQGDVLSYEPTSESAGAFQARKARVLALPDGAPPEARMREMKGLAWFVAEDRMRRAIVTVPPGSPVDALKAEFPDAYAATHAEFVERTRRSPDDVRRFLRHYMEPKPPGEGKRAEGLRGAALLYLKVLEQAAPWLASDPEARSRADAFLERLYVHGLHLPADAWDRLPGWDRPGDRLRALRRLLVR